MSQFSYYPLMRATTCELETVSFQGRRSIFLSKGGLGMSIWKYAIMEAVGRE